MSDGRDDKESPQDEDRKLLRELIERQTEILNRLGNNGQRPLDAIKAAQWDMPLAWQLGHLGESLHTLRNIMHSLMGEIAKFGGKLDRNEDTNQAILEATESLTIISKKIDRSAEDIALQVGVVAAKQPLLMRDVFWIDTEAVELGLILYTGLSAAIFLAGDDKLMSSALFSSMSIMSGNSTVWAIVCFGICIGTTLSFLSRKKLPRTIFALMNFLYFGATGSATLWLAPGVPGWAPHLAAAFGAAWIVSRGPSRSI